MARRKKQVLGQHFLEPAWSKRVVEILAPKSDDIILEIGAGTGSLTRQLAKTGASIIAIEIDSHLAEQLTRDLPDNVRILNCDFLRLTIEEILEGNDQPIRVAGNLPYSVSTQILRRLLTLSAHGNRIQDGALMFQKEVAKRVAAVPGTKDWGPLGVTVRLSADPKEVLALPRGAFRPMPEVQSSLVTLRFCHSPVEISNTAIFTRLVNTLFNQRRKTAANALEPLVPEITRISTQDIFKRAGVDPKLRPEKLKLAELADLSEVLAQSAL
tara:strand:- start:12743 stop:13552 length:810 start_codon:yes stop_codon:yes gene_type:complete